jgi:hypothetical protein
MLVKSFIFVFLLYLHFRQQDIQFHDKIKIEELDYLSIFEKW